MELVNVFERPILSVLSHSCNVCFCPKADIMIKLPRSNRLSSEGYRVIIPTPPCYIRLMRYLLPILLTLLLTLSATAQDSFADDDKFQGYIGPTSEAQRAQAGEMILEMPNPNTATKFGANGEFVLIYTEDFQSALSTQLTAPAIGRV